MKPHYSRSIGLFLGAVLFLGLALRGVAQEPKAKGAEKQAQRSGTVHMINKDNSTITLQRGNTTWQVVYNDSTKFEYGSSRDHKPSSLDQLKEGYYMYCGGKFDGVKLVASTCRFREAK